MTLCPGDSLVYPGEVLVPRGFANLHLPAQNGCDRTVHGFGHGAPGNHRLRAVLRNDLPRHTKAISNWTVAGDQPLTASTAEPFPAPAFTKTCSPGEVPCRYGMYTAASLRKSIEIPNFRRWWLLRRTTYCPAPSLPDTTTYCAIPYRICTLGVARRSE